MNESVAVLRVISQGAHSVATDSKRMGPAMPAFGWQLNDARTDAAAH
jgi:hypothetical protein